MDDDGGAQERAILTDAGYKDALDNLTTDDGIKVTGTMNPFSYDAVQPEKGKFGGQPDHVYVKLLSKLHTYRSKSHVNVKKYDGTDADNKARTEAELVMDAQGKSLRDTFCSDHLPGIVDIEIVANKQS